MRRALALLFLAACAPAAAPPTVVVAEAAPAAAAPDAPPPASPERGLGERLLGAWAWNSDVSRFAPRGKGTYFRDGEVCYEFTWAVADDVLTVTADRDHHCGATRELSFHVHFERGELVKRHVGSGFESRWKRAEGKAEPR